MFVVEEKEMREIERRQQPRHNTNNIICTQKNIANACFEEKLKNIHTHTLYIL